MISLVFIRENTSLFAAALTSVHVHVSVNFLSNMLIPVVVHSLSEILSSIVSHYIFSTDIILLLKFHLCR